MIYLIRVFALLRANSNEDGRTRMSRLLLAGETVGALTDHSVAVVVRLEDGDNRYEVEALGHVAGSSLDDAMKRFAVVLDVGIKDGLLLSFEQEDWTAPVVDLADQVVEATPESEEVLA